MAGAHGVTPARRSIRAAVRHGRHKAPPVGEKAAGTGVGINSAAAGVDRGTSIRRAVHPAALLTTQASSASR